MYLSRNNELLSTHIENVKAQYKYLCKYKNIDEILANIIEKICKENIYLNKCEDIIYFLFIKTLELHDEGKKNPYFQAFINNKEFQQYRYNDENKHHSQISSFYYCIEMIDVIIDKVKAMDIKSEREKKNIKANLLSIMYTFALIIYSHHSSLKNFNLDSSLQGFKNYLIEYYEEHKDRFYKEVDISELKKYYNFNLPCTDVYTKYIFFKLSYSILITCDFMAVYKFNHNENLYLNIIDKYKLQEFKNKFENEDIIKKNRSFKNKPSLELSEINKFRAEMFLEGESNLDNTKSMYYLESPTGSGKSLTSLNLALKSIDKKHNKIYYVAPLNNISEQTYKTIKKYISTENKDVVLVNSNEEIVCNEDYSTDYLDYQLLNYQFTLLSHVRFFNILFSEKRIHNLMLPMVCNSIVILDEIQVYKNKLWIHIINSLKAYAELLNIKIIIMSATLPKMDNLIEENYIVQDLILNRNYYYDFFKNRVSCNFDLLKHKKITIDKLYEIIDKNIINTDKHRILIQCLSTKRVEQIYMYLKNKYKEFKVYKMLGFTNQCSRNYIINEIQCKYKNKYINQKVILIGTQCIEAGIDIDMNIGYKDISILDSDEQFLGRICRNFDSTGIVYFFDLDDEKFIYKDDYRSQFNLYSKEMQDLFINKSFNKFYKTNYISLKENEFGKYNEFKNSLNNLQFQTISETMKLIDSENIAFFFIYKYKDNGEIIDGALMLKEYKELIETNYNNYEYSELQIKKKRLKKHMDKFIYSINKFNFKSINILKEKENGFYIIKDGVNYMDNLQDNKYVTNKSSLILEKFIENIEYL